MDLIWLEDYLALAETLSFSKAAEARHVTQPAFSRRIRALEDWLGTPLFTRTTHRVTLTPAGEHFHSQAALLTRALHQLRRETLDAAGRGAGPLSIAATHVLSFTFFPKWVRSSEKILALGNLNLVSDSMTACERMMLRGDVSFLLCHHHRSMGSRLDNRQFKSIVVGTDTLVPLSVAGVGRKPRWSLQNDETVPYLAYSPQSGLGRIVAGQLAKSHLKKIFTSHLAATLLSMVRSGDGIAWLPRTLAEDDIEAGSLVQAGDAKSVVPIEIRLFRPAARQGQDVEALWSAFEAAEVG